MQNSEKFIVDYLKEKIPDLDVRSGTGVRDVLVRPFVGILNRILEDIDELKVNSNLLNHEVVDPDVFDRLVSNWFVARDTGRKSRGVVRVFLNQPEDVEISEGHRFVYGSDRLVFLATDVFFFPKEHLNKVLGVDEWYFDVNLEAVEEGLQYNIDPGEFVEYDPISVHVVRAECVESFVNGINIEDNAALYERLKKAITVRNLINPLSIETVLREGKEFFVRDLYVAGFGSPEMWRDYISGDLGSFHIGNMTDIYVKMQVVTRTKKYTVGSDQKIVFDAEDVPIYRIVEFNGSPSNLPVLSFSSDYLFRFSKREGPFIQTALSAGTEINVKFDTVDIDVIDNYINNSEHRVTTASLMVRGLAPVYVSCDVRYKQRQGTAPIDEGVIIEKIRQYINGLSIGNAPEVSDIDMLVRNLYNEIDRVVLPLTLNGVLYDFAGNRTSFSSQDALTVAEDLSHSLSQRTVVYIADMVTVAAL